VELKQILGAVGSTTIVVTHDQDEAMSLADRIIVMNRGRIEQQGVPDDIYSRPASPFVATFIGRTNWFHGTISRVKPGRDARVVTASGTLLTVSDPGIEDDKDVSVCVRPERLTVATTEAKRSGSDANQLPGTITDMINMGAEFHYSVDSAIGSLMVIEPNRGGTRDKVCIGFRAEDCVVLSRSLTPRHMVRIYASGDAIWPIWQRPIGRRSSPPACRHFPAKRIAGG
jgi:putative spermidine/putrescine transport system ATP-binding protein/putrescine transport system ATP-binding protein